MRLDGWETRLSEYLERMGNSPFVWGKADCCHFAAEGARLITGVDTGSLYACDSARSAARLVSGHGGIVAIASAHYFTQRLSKARQGDIVSAEIDDGLALGICNGDHGLFKSADGLTAIPLKQCKQAWKVG